MRATSDHILLLRSVLFKDKNHEYSAHLDTKRLKYKDPCLCTATTELTSFIFRAHLNKLFEEQNKPQGYVKPVCYAPTLSKRIIYMKAHSCLPFYIFSQPALTAPLFMYDLTGCREEKVLDTQRHQLCSHVLIIFEGLNGTFVPFLNVHVCLLITKYIKINKPIRFPWVFFMQKVSSFMIIGSLATECYALFGLIKVIWIHIILTVHIINKYLNFFISYHRRTISSAHIDNLLKLKASFRMKEKWDSSDSKWLSTVNIM